MTGEPDERAVLAAEFPAWVIGMRWSAAGSGPDGFCWTARRGPVTLSSVTADGLRREIRGTGS